ncbi:MAG: sulfur carrier protein ThiS adenylyltransferase ThiF [Candidatus Riflemargulisbacteria bacterium]
MRNLFEEGLLRYLTVEQLGKIQRTKIGIAGVGGLGSNIAHALVRTGFVDFEIVDIDYIDASNLNRQNYYYDEVGQSKVEVTAKRLQQINPDVQVKLAQIKLNKENIKEYFSDSDILFEAFDKVESKILLLESFGNSGKLLISGNGMSGVVGEVIKVRQLSENLYLVGDGVTEVGQDNPPLAPRVIACASLMASVAVERVLL